MVYYIYLLESEDGRRCYVGSTCDIGNRLRFYNIVRSDNVKRNGRWILTAYNTFEKQYDAIKEKSRLKRLQNPEMVKEAFKNKIHSGTVGTVLSVSYCPAGR